MKTYQPKNSWFYKDTSAWPIEHDVARLVAKSSHHYGFLVESNAD